MATPTYCDNLEILRRHLADESVDLVYLDPPPIPAWKGVDSPSTPK